MFDWRSIQWHYINLASRHDRDRHVRREFDKVGLRAQRFEAFTPDQWTGNPAKVARMQADVGGTPGAVGCYMSQTAIIRTAVDSDRIVAVCEDDVCFCCDLQKRLGYIAEHLSWDWDIFYLGATFHVPGEWFVHEDCAQWAHLGLDAEPTADKHVMRVYGEWGTYAYLVNGRNARKVLDLFDANLHLARGIDHLAIILGPKLNAFCFVPGCAWQYDNKSDIGTGVTRFSGFKRLGPYVWSERVEDFDPAGFDWKKGCYRDV